MLAYQFTFLSWEGKFIQKKIYKIKIDVGDFICAKIVKLFVQFYSGDINSKELNEEITKAPIDELLAIYRDIKFTH